jgi:hypothetical protein
MLWSWAHALLDPRLCRRRVAVLTRVVFGAAVGALAAPHEEERDRWIFGAHCASIFGILYWNVVGIEAF